MPDSLNLSVKHMNLQMAQREPYIAFKRIPIKQKYYSLPCTQKNVKTYIYTPSPNHC